MRNLADPFVWLFLACCTTACTASAISQAPPNPSTSGPPPVRMSQPVQAFPVKVSEVYGYMDKTGRLLVAPQFVVAGQFHEGLAQVYLAPHGDKLVKQKGQNLQFYVDRGFIGPSGNLKFRVNFLENQEYNRQSLIPTAVGEFSEGRAVIELRNRDLSSKRGYIDTNGQLVIGATFDFAEPFSEGLAAVEVIERGWDLRWGFIDLEGKSTIPYEFSHARSFTQGMAAVQDPQTQLWGYINTHGEYIIPARFLAAWSFSEGYAVVEVEAGRTLIDKSGQQLGTPAPAIGRFSEGLAAVNVGGEGVTWPGTATSDAAKGGKWGYRDAVGNMVIAPQFQAANAFSEGRAAVNVGGQVKDLVIEGGKWGFIDKSGHLEVMAQFDDASEFRSGLARVETWSGLFDSQTHSFYIDPTGNEINPTSKGTNDITGNDNADRQSANKMPDPKRTARESFELAKQAASDHDGDLAMELYTKALLADPHFYKAAYNRALIYIERDELQEAAADFSRTLTEQPDIYQAYHNRGNCYLKLGKFREAVSDFTQALKYQPGFNDAYVGRAQAYVALGKDREAWQDITTVTNHGGTIPPFLVDFLRKKDSSKSGETYENITVSDQLSEMRPSDLKSAHRTSGLFIGISNYPKQSGVLSTPAHTIGAALFHEIFYRSEANRLGLTIERNGLGHFISEYHPAPNEILFKYRGGSFFEATGNISSPMPQPEIPNLTLIADLRIDPRDMDVNPRGVVRILAGIDGSWLQLRDHATVPVALSPPGQLWPYFGHGDYISRSAVLTALEKSLGQATQSMHESIEFFIFYIAAHGRIDKDWSPFLITANDELAAPESLSYDDVLKVVGKAKVPFENKRLIRIVVFDACQESADMDLEKAHATHELHVPPDTIVITSTSPGHYAWQLPSSVLEHHEAEVNKPGLLTRREDHVFDQQFSSKASAFPIASNAALKDLEHVSESVTVNDWLSKIASVLPTLLSSANITSDFQTVDWHPQQMIDESVVLFKKIPAEGKKP